MTNIDMEIMRKTLDIITVAPEVTVTTSDLAEVIRYIDLLIYTGHTDDLDKNMLDLSNNDDIHILIGITFLRTPYMVRHYFSNWTKLRDHMKIIFDRRGYDSAKMLKGLY